tara:strand:+ start:3763 stop:4440 length:678 start_codon:yes stop_codon:yes gene_type:complete
MSHDYLLKAIILGDSKVGKTCLSESMVLQVHRPEYIPTIGVDFKSFVTTSDENKNVKVHLWDTAGAESFKKIIINYCRGVSCALIVYDVTNRESFQNVERWLSYFQANTACTGHNHPIFIIANKCDLSHKRVITKEEGRRFASSQNLYYLETSAVASLNTSELRTLIVRRVFSKLISQSIFCKGYNVMHDCHLVDRVDRVNKDTYIRMPYTKPRYYNYPRCCTIL